MKETVNKLYNSDKIKKAFDFIKNTDLLTTSDGSYEIQGKDFISPFSAKATNEIVSDRLGMIAEYILKCLDRCEFEFPEYIPIYFTGGGINYIKGAKDYMSRRLGRRVELVAPNLPHISRPDYSSEIGLLDLVLDNLEDDKFLFVK